MRLRMLGLSLIMLVLLTVSSVVGAQDTSFDPCFGLDGADCDVINTAFAAGLPTDNYTLNMSIDFSFMGQSFDPEVPAAEVLFNMTGSINVAQGEFTPNVSGLFTLNASSANLGQLAALAGGAPAGDEEVAIDPIEGLVIEFRIVDDLLYFINPEDGTWQSLDLIAVLEDPALEQGIQGLPINPNDLEGEAAEALGDVDVASVEMALGAIANLPGLFAYTRTGDDFAWVMDLTALAQLQEEENADTLAALGNAVASATGDEEAAAQVDVALGLVLGLLGPGSTISVTQSVDATGSFVESLAFDTVLEIALLGSVNLDVDMSFDNYDGVTPAVAPEDATVIDPEQLTGVLGMIGSLGLGG